MPKTSGEGVRLIVFLLMEMPAESSNNSSKVKQLDTIKVCEEVPMCWLTHCSQGRVESCILRVDEAISLSVSLLLF